jgi:hypothetical protein
VLFHPANARFQFADEHAVAFHAGVVFEHLPAKPFDQSAGRLVLGVDLACIVSRSDATSARSEFMSAFSSDLSSPISARSPPISEQMPRSSSRTRFSGSPAIGEL